MIRNLWRALLSLALIATAPIAAQAQQLVGEGLTPGTKIEILDLKRDGGGMVTLRFQLSNGSSADLKLHQLAASKDDWGPHGLHAGPPPPSWGVVSAVHLVDAANRKKYLVVRDSEKKCVCALHAGSVKAGQKLNLWAKFPAPPESVQNVTVIVPAFEPVENVPIIPARSDGHIDLGTRYKPIR